MADRTTTATKTKKEVNKAQRERTAERRAGVERAINVAAGRLLREKATEEYWAGVDKGANDLVCEKKEYRKKAHNLTNFKIGMVMFGRMWKRCKGRAEGEFPTEEVLAGLAKEECERAWAKVCVYLFTFC